jgi:hypothetical protein
VRVGLSLVACGCLVLAGGCGSAKPVRVYTGETDQNLPVRVRLSGDRERLTYRIVWQCPVVAGLAPITTGLDGMPVLVSAADTFSYDVDYTYPLSEATRARVQGQMSGRLSGRGLITGVFHPQLTYVDPASAGRARCDPGAISFTART